MARIRSVKPEFFTSPSTAKLTPNARIFFIAMWCWADDYGKGETNLNGLLGLAFPESDNLERKDVQSFCKEVQSACNVEFYVVEERAYYAIPSWDRHQKTQRKAESRIPGPDDPRAAPDPRFQAEVGTVSENQGASLSKQGKNTPGTGEQGNRGTGEQSLSRTGSADTQDRDPSTAELFDQFWEIYPRKDDKKKAWEAFGRALKRADFQTIVNGAANYRDDPNREAQFTKYPATWLNADAWDNGPLPAKNQTQQFKSSSERRYAQGMDLMAKELAEYEQQRMEIES